MGATLSSVKTDAISKTVTRDDLERYFVDVILVNMNLA